MRGRARVASLMYHEVTDDPATSGFQRPAARPYTLSLERFGQHLRVLAAGPLAPGLVTSVDLAAPGRSLLLTFDDGGRSALDAAERLARLGWTAHFFAVTGRIGARTFLDRAGIRELRRLGHVVGTHSHTHPDIFRDLARGAMVAEWTRSADILAQLLGEPCRVGSVPGGDISRPVLESAAEAGLDFLFTSEPWVRSRRVGATWVLGRYAVRASTSTATLAGLIQFRRWRRAWLLRRLKGAARVGLRPLYRRYVSRVTGAALMDAGPR